MIRLALLALASTALVAAGCGDDAADGAQPEPRAEAAQTAGSDPAMEEKGSTAAARGTTVKVVSSQFGRVIADGRGEAVYLFDRERTRRSRCYGACAVAWPPLLTKAEPRAGRGAKSELLGTTRRRDGRLQVTYSGHPLYYYKDDDPGRILCHNVDEFGGLWLVVRPSGRAVG